MNTTAAQRQELRDAIAKIGDMQRLVKESKTDPNPLAGFGPFCDAKSAWLDYKNNAANLAPTLLADNDGWYKAVCALLDKGDGTAWIEGEGELCVFCLDSTVSYEGATRTVKHAPDCPYAELDAMRREYDA